MKKFSKQENLFLPTRKLLNYSEKQKGPHRSGGLSFNLLKRSAVNYLTPSFFLIDASAVAIAVTD